MIAAIAALEGWKRNAAAWLMGGCAVLTLPPFFLFPLIVPAYGGLYLLLANAAPRRAFADGWWWGWGFAMCGLYWFCIALLTEPEKFAWLIPFALFALTAVIAIYNGVVGWLFSRLRVRGVAGIFVFSAIWTLVEFARGHWFTGFPWNLGGYAAGFADAPLQLASLIGAYGLTWLVVFLGAIPAALVLHYKHAKPAVALCCGIFILGCGWGMARLQSADTNTVPDVTLRLVQANIAQHHKWDPALQMAGLREHVRLTQLPGLEKVTHVIWPETAIPYVVREHSALTRALGEALPPGRILVAGGLRGDGQAVYNSIVALDWRGERVGGYDKHKLVPFGEFLPLRALIPDRLETPVGMKDFSAGPGPQTLHWPGLPAVSPLICYEAIFPGLATAAERPQLLLNLTNDAWFGLSTGPYQHFQMARMRAVEQGVPLVRVANTGISAMVDAYGRIGESTNLGEAGILDVRVPLTTLKPTYYSKYHDFSLLGIFLIALLLIFRQRISLIG